MPTRDTVDYSFGRPNLTALKQAGFNKVMRYLSPNGQPKTINDAERESLHANGMSVGFVFEWYAARAKEGRSAGEIDGHLALQQANELGIPADVPLFAAVDYDAPESDQPALNDYMDGFASVVGERGKAAYGGYWLIKRLFDAGKIKYGWQTYAWSGGNWDERAQLRQVLNGQTVGGGAVDFNETLGDVVWEPSNEAAPAPAPAVPSGETHGYALQKGDTMWGLEAANGWTHGTLQALNPSWIGREGAMPIGTVLQIPGAGEQASAPAPQYTSLGKHTVVAGDTFTGLDEKNGWPQGTTQGLNPGVNARTLQIGAQINVLAGGSQPVATTTHTHIIAGGDTFWGLEKANGWATGTLQHMNPNKVATALRVGDTITTP
jgi:LysM repeat protein